MTSAWHWFVIVGTLGSLAAMGWLLMANRKAVGENKEPHEWDGITELDTPLPMWWVWMFVLSIVFSLGYLVYYPGLGNFEGTSGWTSDKRVAAENAAHDARFAPLYTELAALDVAQLHQNRRAAQIGRRLFINRCSTCHGVAAQGGFGFPNLTDEEWIWGEGYTAITTAITQGRQAAMPGWLPVLGEPGVQDTTAYVLSLSGQTHDAAAAERGSKNFQTFCVACHGADGKGNALLGAPNLTNNIWLYGGGADQIAFTVRHGRNGNMPAHADLLTPEKTKLLAAYILSLSAP